jgi:hypothetical protein
MTVERYKEIVLYHIERRKLIKIGKAKKLHPRVDEFWRWFDREFRTQEDVDAYWGRKKGRAAVSPATEEFIAWLKAGPRTKGEVASYWKNRRHAG